MPYGPFLPNLHRAVLERLQATQCPQRNFTRSQSPRTLAPLSRLTPAPALSGFLVSEAMDARGAVVRVPALDTPSVAPNPGSRTPSPKGEGSPGHGQGSRLDLPPTISDSILDATPESFYTIAALSLGVVDEQGTRQKQVLTGDGVPFSWEFGPVLMATDHSHQLLPGAPPPSTAAVSRPLRWLCRVWNSYPRATGTCISFRRYSIH
jgi:hypothetical protein